MMLRAGTAAAVVLILTLTVILALPGMADAPFFRGLGAANWAGPGAVITPEPLPAVLVGGGDISVCGQAGDTHTAALIEALLNRNTEAVVFTAGDNAQSMGQPLEYSVCFEETWGRFKDRIRPSPGNHDWFTEQGGPYFAYFGEAAGPSGLGYYSYDLGDWHIVSLNSNCGEDCGADSAQAAWLRADLEASDKSCTLLYWHHPLWSSGTVPIDPAAEALWRIASQYGAEVVVNGHDHMYERMAPLGPTGLPEPETGIRLFIAGTGGAWHFEEGQPYLASQARAAGVHGVLLFFLYSNRYDWHFIPVDGSDFVDSGSGTCH